MVEKTSSVDLAQALSDFDRAIIIRDEASRNARELRDTACAKWTELSGLRDKKLKDILDKRGLDLCSYSDHLPLGAHRKVYPYNIIKRETEIDIDEVKKLRLEDIGIFPKSELRLHYSRQTHYGGMDYLETYHQHQELELLCSKHFPDKTNETWKSKAEENDGNDVLSEVIEKDGKLLTKVGAIDVSAVPVEKTYSEPIYRYFGLPELPPKPEI